MPQVRPGPIQAASGPDARTKLVEESLKSVGLSAKADSLGKSLSGGQKRKLSVAMALIGSPQARTYASAATFLIVPVPCPKRTGRVL